MYMKRTKRKKNKRKNNKSKINKLSRRKLNKSKTSKRNILQKGGMRKHVNDLFTKDPVWRDNFSTLVQFQTWNNMDAKTVYGSSLPVNDIFGCIRTFAYYMYVKDIRVIINLQGPGINGQNPLYLLNHREPTPHYPNNRPDTVQQAVGPRLSANGTPWTLGSDIPNDDNDYMRQAWEGLSQLTTYQRNLNPTYHYIQMKDMTAGNYHSWRAISAINFQDDTKKLVHCYAGFGRTGSVLLYAGLQGWPDLANRITLPFLGLSTSGRMFHWLYSTFQNHLLGGANNRDSVAVNTAINNMPRMNVRDELFKIETISQANTFIRRINFILIFIAQETIGLNTGDQIYLYKDLFTDRLNINRNYGQWNQHRILNMQQDNIFVPVHGQIEMRRGDGGPVPAEWIQPIWPHVPSGTDLQ